MKYDKHIKKGTANTIEEAHLYNFGLSSTNQLNEWFVKYFNDEYKIKDIDRAIELINQFKDKYICVFGDYDVDGITATSIIVNALKYLNFKNISFKIPRRKDGFGMSRKLIDELNSDIEEINLKPEDVLIITVDNGIAAIDEVKYAKEIGYSIIVTDHHQPTIENNVKLLPDADIIINPNAIDEQAGFNGYCGAGVAYKIARALINNDKAANGLLRPIATFGTVCDQMQLIEENYVLVYKGLEDLNLRINSLLPAFRAMRDVFNISNWNADTIGFTCGPPLNALERLHDDYAKFGVELLTSYDYKECVKLAIKIKEINEIRKNETTKGVGLAQDMISSLKEIKAPIILNIPNIKEGIVGILAGRITEEYKLPCGIFTEGEDSILKGSFRSPENFDIKQLMDSCSSLFYKYGGHKAAAGASVKKECFDDMVTAMQKNAKKMGCKINEDNVYYYDLEISNEELENMIVENSRFEPTGNGHDKLKFKINNFELVPNYGQYVKKIAGNGAKLTSPISTAIGFGLYDLVADINAPCTLNLYGSIEYNYYKSHNGKLYITPQILFDDVEILEKEKVNTQMSNKLFNMAKNRY